jgi:hypothetical protein
MGFPWKDFTIFSSLGLSGMSQHFIYNPYLSRHVTDGHSFHVTSMGK